MLQEFRYLTPGGLFVAFIVIGLSFVSPERAKGLAIVGALGSVALGWISYQWLGYLAYRRGGLESYHEMSCLRSLLLDDAHTTIELSLGGRRLTLSRPEVLQELEALGQRYHEALESIGHRQTGPRLYTAALHDMLFDQERSHDLARAAYGVHHTLTMIYWVIAWGLVCLVVGWSACLAERPLSQLLLLTTSLVVCESVAMIVSNRLNWRLPPDFFLILVVLHGIPAIALGDLESHLMYGLSVGTFLAYLVYKSCVSWRIMRLEAELREEFLTWVYGRMITPPTDLVIMAH